MALTSRLSQTQLCQLQVTSRVSHLKFGSGNFKDSPSDNIIIFMSYLHQMVGKNDFAEE